MLPLATKHMTKKRDEEIAARERDQQRQIEREDKRRQFEEHHRLHHDVSVLRGAVNRVKETARRLATHANPKRKPKVKTAGERRDALAKQLAHTMRVSPLGGSVDHVMLPMPAVNKAATGEELASISYHVQGFVLAHEARHSGVASYGQGPHRGALATLSEEDRSELVAMHNHVNKYLPLTLAQMLEVIVAQTLASTDGRVPTLSDIGGVITASDDERVRKGGVIGYYRALFQAVGGLQKEFRIKEAVRRIAAKNARDGK